VLPLLRIRDFYPGFRIPDPEFYPSQIPDPKTAIKERGEKICCHTFFCCHKIKHFEMLKEKLWADFQRIIELFTQKIITELSKIWVGIRKKPIPDPGSRGQKGTGFRIPDPDPQHCVLHSYACGKI
jgi:hypothetical protein